RNIYGNVIDQNIELYGMVADSYQPAEYKTIHNTYDSDETEFLGNPDHVEVVRYLSFAIADGVKTGVDKIERSVTDNHFNDYWNIEKSETTTYVVNSLGDEVRAKEVVTENFEINRATGNAEIQHITTYTTDSTGEFIMAADGVTRVASGYQVISNRMFDARGNVWNQRIQSYTHPTLDEANFVQAQEIRSSGFLSSGVAMHQLIATYDNTNLLLDVKLVENRNVTVQGYVQESETTRYTELSRPITDSDSYSALLDLIVPANYIDRQVVTSTYSADRLLSEFDVRGNALTQHIDTYFNNELGHEKLFEHQDIDNHSFDIHDRADHSTIETKTMDYAEDSIPSGEGAWQALQKQEIYITSRNIYGNVIDQNIELYGMVADSYQPAEYKTIHNTYDSDETEFLGNPD
ncbi:MAG: hypothetical protein Q8N46_11000, partial [Anaerolineales bacterium]|nr:hypothetical protein [Anaerolineales bacterium]